MERYSVTVRVVTPQLLNLCVMGAAHLVRDDSELAFVVVRIQE